MTLVFYRSVTDGWRLGVADSLEGINISVRNGEIEETVPFSDIYVPQSYSGEGEADALFHMEQHPSVFLQKRDAALMSPTPLVGMPPLVQLLRYRACNDEYTTDIGDNFSLLLGEGSLLDVDPPGHDTILKAVLAWRGSQRRQVVVSCGNAQPDLFSNLLETSCKLLGATKEWRKVLLAGMDVLSAFTTTIIKQQQLCYLQANIFAKLNNGKEKEEFQGVCVDCNHLFTSGIGYNNDFNFKIFAYILYGLNDEERDQLFINRKQQDFTCQKSIEDKKLVLQLKKEYLRFAHAMQTIGIPQATREALFRQMAAIIHLTEIEFYADGSLANFSALKNVAHLFQLNVDECKNVFSSREACVAAARMLYNAIFLSIVKNVNCAFGSIGDLTLSHSSLTVLALPPLSFVGYYEKDLNRLVRAAIYEGVLQTFIVSSDQELTQLQSAGLKVPEKLQAALDKFDNYRLLKVLYGVGGVLSVAREKFDMDKLIPALENCARSSYVKFDANMLVLTIEHFFGTRNYQFPRNLEEMTQLKTVHHAEFQAVRSFLIEKINIDTKEALQLFEQTEGRAADQVIALEMLHVRPLLDILQDGKNTFWWIGNIDLGVGFDANHVETQLRELPVLCAMELRSRLPYRYVMCCPAFIASTFKLLLPPGKTAATDDTQEIAKAILCFSDAKWCTNVDNFFVTGDSLVEMNLRVSKHLCQQATVIQAFARAYFCGITLKRRVTACLTVVENVEKRRNKTIENNSYEFHNKNFCQMQFLDLMEKENNARSTILEEYWEENIALKGRFQEKLEGLMVDIFASSIKKEEKQLNSVLEYSQKEKFKLFVGHFKQCLREQKAHLDGVVEGQLDQNERQTYDKKLQRINKNLLRASLQKEERRMDLKTARERREAKLFEWQKKRGQEVEEKRERMRKTRSQSQILRKQLCHAQDEFYDALATQIALRDTKGTLLRSVKDEILSFRRQQNERLLLKQREERQRIEAAAIRAAKANEQRAAQRELCQRLAAETERLHKQRMAWRRLEIQQRHQKAAERQLQAAERRRRAIVRKVSAALPGLATPVLYKHSDQQEPPRARSCGSGPPEEFVLTSGKKIYSRMLSESSIRGLIQYHATKPRAKSPYPYATVK